MRTIQRMTLLLSALCVVGCATKRDVALYRADTRALVATQDNQISSCYDQFLDQNPSAGGRVTVNFTVQKETGRLVNAWVDQNQTTAPEPLSACVIDTVLGLRLAHHDRREAHVRFVWDFVADDRSALNLQTPATTGVTPVLAEHSESFYGAAGP